MIITKENKTRLYFIIPAVRLLAIGVLMLFSFTCTRVELPLQGVITFSVGTVRIDGAAAGTGDTITLNKTLTTEKKSMCVIQFHDTALITIRENAHIKLASIEKGARDTLSISISQQRGATYNRILRKGSDYSVKTPTMLAAVRGTSFLVEIGDKKTSTAVLKGKVSVAFADSPEPGKATDAAEGFIVEVADTGAVSSPVEIPGETIEIMNSFEKIQPVKSLESEEQIEKLKKDTTEEHSNVIPEEIRVSVVPQRPSLADIKKEHGDLCKIITTDGREYIGAFKQEGKWMEIVTVERTHRIPTKDVKKVSRFTEKQ